MKPEKPLQKKKTDQSLQFYQQALGHYKNNLQRWPAEYTLLSDPQLSYIKDFYYTSCILFEIANYLASNQVTSKYKKDLEDNFKKYLDYKETHLQIAKDSLRLCIQIIGKSKLKEEAQEQLS